MEEKYLAFDASPSKRHKDRNGYLHVKLTPITKATVNPYLGKEIPGYENLSLDPEAIYYGLRDPDELKKAATTFNGLPLLNGHHIESAELPQKEARIGATGTDAVYEHPYLLVSISVMDANAISGIEDDTCKEISSGYKYKPDFSKVGEYEGVKYDFVMRDIEGNHVALVPDGRAGADVVVVDSMPQIMRERTVKMRKIGNNKKATKANLMTKIYALDEALQKATDTDPEVKAKAEELLEIAEEIAEEQKSDVNTPALDDDIDFNLPAEDIIKANAPALEGEALEFVRKLIGMIQQKTQATDNLPDDQKLAADAVSDEQMAKIVAALKDTPSDDLWAAFRGLTDTVDKTRGRDLLDKMLQALSGAATDNTENLKGEKEKEAMIAADANIISKKVEESMTKKFRSLTNAAQKCRSILGNNLDPLAFDSAEAIYAKALQHIGLNPKEYPREAYQAMVDMHKRSQYEAGFACDAKPLEADDESEAVFKRLEKIKSL